jgi:hypothetical protein
MMQHFAVSVLEHAENTGTKPVQVGSTIRGSFRIPETKNPGSAATETGIRSLEKASSFPKQYITLHDHSSSDEVRS